jgi:lysophospholipase L1-like esterase
VSDVAVWTDGANRQILELDRGGGAVDKLNLQRTTNNSQLQLGLRGNNTSRNVLIGSLALTDWFHLALVWSAAGSYVTGYLNGVQQGVALGAPVTWAGAPDRSTIGAFSTAGSSAWKGQIAHVAVWGTPLAGADIAVVARRNGLVVFDGDSRTVGGQGGSTPYPDQTMATAGVTAKQYGSTVVATSGLTVAQLISRAATTVDVQYRSGTANNLVVLGGTNDATAGADAATIYSRIVSYSAARIAAGFRVIVCTELPASDTAHNNVTWNTTRATLNTSIRNGAAANGYTVADLAADANIGADGASDNVTYYQTDKLHLTTAGYGVMAGIVAGALA